MGATVEARPGIQEITPGVKLYETRGWKADENPPIFLIELAVRIKTMLSGTQDWENVFIKAAIVDTDGLKQDINSYFTNGPSENSPQFIILGFEFVSSKAPKQFKFGERQIAIRRTINPFFHGRIERRKRNEYLLWPNTELTNFLGNSIGDATRRNKLWSFGALRLTDDPIMYISQAPPDILELAKTDLDFVYPNRLYAHMVLDDNYSILRKWQKQALEEKRLFEERLPALFPKT